MNRQKISYIADFINEELDRGHTIDENTINDAIDAYKGGAAQIQNKKLIDSAKIAIDLMESLEWSEPSIAREWQDCIQKMRHAIGSRA